MITCWRKCCVLTESAIRSAISLWQQLFQPAIQFQSRRNGCSWQAIIDTVINIKRRWRIADMANAWTRSWSAAAALCWRQTFEPIAQWTVSPPERTNDKSFHRDWWPYLFPEVNQISFGSWHDASAMMAIISDSIVAGAANLISAGDFALPPVRLRKASSSRNWRL